ncbi:hypothetical protein JOF29_002174 [Kribbella aluminosa]|uniref:Uncharacterized protein n=1 Tax=Kribbella aluminosa TaxID=416017 RepID=A0ABS4UHG7_9ACTN|nr:hypothetical protein [Kribbella aluminosa]MBP2351091.1 hypothetical protein [Kribbella aluminosa]
MSTFEELMSEVMSTAERFGHREHVRLTWLAVRRCGTADAVDLISDGIRRTARYAGAPQKYNATVSRAWVELTAYHMNEAPTESFDQLVERNPGLLNKRLLTHFYNSHTLATPDARTGWVQPDVRPFPFTLP